MAVLSQLFTKCKAALICEQSYPANAIKCLLASSFSSEDWNKCFPIVDVDFYAVMTCNSRPEAVSHFDLECDFINRVKSIEIDNVS